MEPKSFVETFEAIRRRRGLSTCAVARGAGLSEASIRRFTKLKDPTIPLSTVVALATGLGLTLEDEDCKALLRSAGYEPSDLSFYLKAIRENWPEDEGLRITINHLRMQISQARLFTTDLLVAAPMTDIQSTSMEVDMYLRCLIASGLLLNMQFKEYDKIAHPYKGQRKERKAKSAKEE